MVKIRIGVEVETRNGVFLRLGNTYEQETPNGPVTTRLGSGFLSYPDRRVTKFVVFIALWDGANYSKYRKLEVPAEASQKANLSYAQFSYPYPTYESLPGETTTPSGPEYTEDEIAALETAQVEQDANLVLISEPYQMRNLRGQNTLQVGNDAEDTVVAFSSAAEAVSQGQYGQFPLFAICKNSAYALEVGEGDVSFSRVTPLALNRGALNRYAVTAIDRSVVFASREGIFALPGGTGSLAAALENSVDPDYKFTLAPDSALHYFVDDESGRRELWVSVDGGVYAYSLDYGVWFTWDGERIQWARLFDKTLGLGTDGVLYRETSSVARSGKIVSVPIDMEQPDVLKRFRRVYEHIGSGTWLHVYNVTDYALPYARDSVDADFISLSIEYEARYEHRPRYRSDLRV